MGLVVDNIKYKNLLNDITIRFSRRKVTGIYGDNSSYLLRIINGDINDNYGISILEKTILDHDFYKEYPSSITLIKPFPYFYTTKVKDEFKFNVDIRKYKCDDLEKREEEMLNAVGLDNTFLDRDINNLSTSEKYLLSIAINLIYNPEVILFEDIFLGLDHINKKRITTLINNLKEDKKIIIVTSKDANILYELTDDIVILNNNVIYKSGTSDKILTSLDVSKENVIPMPSIIKVTYLAKTNKKIKLSFHKDVRDIIKDIYKHV